MQALKSATEEIRITNFSIISHPQKFLTGGGVKTRVTKRIGGTSWQLKTKPV